MLEVAFDILFYLGLLFATLVGFALIWGAAAHLRISVESLRWPRADLEILNITTRATKKEHLVRKELQPGDSSVASYSSKTVNAFYPTLHYANEVDGRRYESMNVDSWNCEASSGPNAADVVAKQRAWAEGRTVAYDPEDPFRHVLGFAHFPVFGTVLGFTLGPFLASGIVVLMRDLLGLFDISVPLLGEEGHSIFFLVVAAFVVLALLFARAKREKAAS